MFFRRFSLLTNSSVLEMIQKNFSGKITYFSAHMDVNNIKNNDNFIAVYSGFSSDTFNCVVPLNSSLQYQELKDITSEYCKSNDPFALWVPDSYSSIHGHAVACGLTTDEKDVGMAMKLSNFERNALILKEGVEVEIKQATSRQELMDFADVISSVFDPPDPAVLEYYSAVSELSCIPSDKYILFVAYYQGEAVSTVSIYLNDDVCGIYDLATKPNMRRKGFGTQMMRHAVEYAKNHDKQYVVLQASEEGLRIYEDLGFRRYCEFVTYSNMHILQNRSDFSEECVQLNP